jgi:hypothetical protein
MKYGPAGKCQQKFQCKFHNERVPCRQIIHNLVNKLRTAGLLIDKKHKQKLHEIGAKLEHTLENH